MFNLKESVNYAIRIELGQKIFCEGVRACYKLTEKLKAKGIETRSGCNEGNMWSVYIISVPWNKEN